MAVESAAEAPVARAAATSWDRAGSRCATERATVRGGGASAGTERAAPEPLPAAASASPATATSGSVRALPTLRFESEPLRLNRIVPPRNRCVCTNLAYLPSVTRFSAPSTTIFRSDGQIHLRGFGRTARAAAAA